MDPNRRPKKVKPTIQDPELGKLTTTERIVFWVAGVLGVLLVIFIILFSIPPLRETLVNLLVQITS